MSEIIKAVWSLILNASKLATLMYCVYTIPVFVFYAFFGGQSIKDFFHRMITLIPHLSIIVAVLSVIANPNISSNVYDSDLEFKPSGTYCYAVRVNEYYDDDRHDQKYTLPAEVTVKSDIIGGHRTYILGKIFFSNGEYLYFPEAEEEDNYLAIDKSIYFDRSLEKPSREYEVTLLNVPAYSEYITEHNNHYYLYDILTLYCMIIMIFEVRYWKREHKKDRLHKIKEEQWVSDKINNLECFAKKTVTETKELHKFIAYSDLEELPAHNTLLLTDKLREQLMLQSDYSVTLGDVYDLNNASLRLTQTMQDICESNISDSSIPEIISEELYLISCWRYSDINGSIRILINLYIDAYIDSESLLLTNTNTYSLRRKLLDRLIYDNISDNYALFDEHCKKVSDFIIKNLIQLKEIYKKIHSESSTFDEQTDKVIAYLSERKPLKEILK